MVDQLRAIEDRLSKVALSAWIYSGEAKDLAVLSECHAVTCRLVDALEETIRRVDDIRDLSSEDPLQVASLEELHDWIMRSVRVRNSLSSILESSGLCPIHFITEGKRFSLEDVSH